ncbi:MAG: branched-chain amino acid ABC transporter permease [Candidatus Caldarchaeum sp.]|nr:branched-chain amino acid ABC transporter permease [Candidatus Caldarchaeum sp.]
MDALVVQVVLNGVINGAILALMASGLTLIFGTFRIPNFAHGGFFTWGAFTTYYLATVYGFSLPLAVAASTVAIAALGVVVEKAVFRPLRNTSEDTIFVAATGLLIAFTNGALVLWGDWPRSIPHEFGTTLVTVGGITIPFFRLIIIATVASVSVLMYLMVKRTKIGKAMRAVAQDFVMARLVGVRPERVASFTFFVGCGLAALAGSLVGIEFSISFDMGILPTIKAFIIVVIGGLGSLTGTLAAGVALGVIDSLTVTYLTSAYNNVITFILLIIILLIRPQGIFGREVRRG